MLLKRRDCRTCKYAQLISATKNSGWSKDTYRCSIGRWYYNDWNYKQFPCKNFKKKEGSSSTIIGDIAMESEFLYLCLRSYWPELLMANVIWFVYCIYRQSFIVG